MRYDLHYWACLFLRNEALLPPPMNHDISDGAIPTPLTMIVTLFAQQEPAPNLLPTINQILEHALSIAKNRGLLSSGKFAHSRNQSQQFILNTLIPQLKQDVEAMQANNPLANATPITDKRARQLYFAIDGKRSIAQLAESTHIDQSEVSSAVQLLLKQKLIRLHEPNGKAIDTSSFIRQL